MKVLRKILLLERKIRSVEALIIKGKLEIKLASSSDKKRVLANSQEEYKNRIFQYKRLIYTYKTVIDGIAFTLFDKYDLKTLSVKEPTGFLSGKFGLKAELHFLRENAKQGNLAILNDLTTCLKYGDVTISKSGFPWVVEIKSSPIPDPESHPQIQRNRHMMNYLITGEAQYTGAITKRANVHAEAQTHTSLLNELIARAVTDGYSLQEVEKGLYYYVSMERPEHENIFTEFIYQNSGRFMILMVNEFKLDNSGRGYTPFTLSIMNPKRFIEFMEGNIIIIVMLDEAYVKSYFNQKGIRYELGLGPDYAIGLTGPDNRIGAGEHFVSRIAAEFVRLDWMLKEMEFKVKSLSALKMHDPVFYEARS